MEQGFLFSKENCPHRWVTYMIHMPEGGYLKPGVTRCSLCGEFQHNTIGIITSTTTFPTTIVVGQNTGQGESKPCTWSEDDEGNWDTTCGEKWCFIEGTPSQNRCRFCAYCGARLVEVVYTEPTDVV